MASVRELLTDERLHYIMWGVAFAGVCVLVGLGKLKPETVEYLLFALLGKASAKDGPKMISDWKEVVTTPALENK